MWRRRLRDRIAERTAEFEKNPALSIIFLVSDIRQAVSRLKRGRTTADDLVSAEMLQALNSEVLLTLACTLTARASGGMAEPKTRTNLNAVCVPKVPRVSLCTQLRPITVVSSLRKLYSPMLLDRVRATPGFLIKNLFVWR